MAITGPRIYVGMYLLASVMYHCRANRYGRTMNLETLLTDVPRIRSKQCRLNVWLMTLSEDDRNAFWRAMDNPDIPLRHIWQTVKSIGCPNQESSIRSHRRGECQTCEDKLNGKSV
jgi:hypothetical protein